MWGEALNAFAIACLVLCAACTALQLWRGLPAQLSRLLDSALNDASEARRVSEDLKTRWAAFQEAAESVLESVERKRAATAASASKMRGGPHEPVPFHTLSREEQKNAIRAKAAQLGL